MPYEPSITLAEDEEFPKIAKFSENQEKSWHTLGTPPKPASSAVCIIKVIAQCGLHVITDRKGRLCFQKRLCQSFCPQREGALPTWGSATGGGGLGRPPGSASRGGLPNPLVVTSSDGRCSSRYASCWNAILLNTNDRFVLFS